MFQNCLKMCFLPFLYAVAVAAAVTALQARGRPHGDLENFKEVSSNAPGPDRDPRLGAGAAAWYFVYVLYILYISCISCI